MSKNIKLLYSIVLLSTLAQVILSANRGIDVFLLNLSVFTLTILIISIDFKHSSKDENQNHYQNH